MRNKLIVICLLSIVLMSCTSMNDNILYEPDKELKDMRGMEPYIKIMERLNKEYGTNIRFPEGKSEETERETGITKEYTYYRTVNQTLEEFEVSAKKMCDAEIESKKYNDETEGD